ncbi:MAG: DUF6159 family protein [Dehalococcoidia bacterium]
MFGTIEQTMSLIGMSWSVLRRDRELLAFPVMAFLAVAAVVGVFAGIAYETGTLERLLAAARRDGSHTELPLGDWVLLGVFYVSVTFTGIFFNAALVAAALERLRGGDPTIASGLAVAASRWRAILGWAIIATTVGLILQSIRERSGFLGRIAMAVVEGVWAYVTFMVVPVLVAEGIGPVEAIQRSGSLLRRTWGQQITAGFGFGVVYVLAMLAALAASVLAFRVSPVLGVPVAALAFTLALSTVAALEGIFKAALYEFASGGSPAGFDRSTLAQAYRAL